MKKDSVEGFSELGEKPIGKLLLQYAIPAIVAMTASSVYNIIDGIFIGRGIGAAAIMGLALTGPVMNLLAAFGAMIGVGGATLMSMRLGQKDYETAQDILDNVLFMNCVMGLTLGFVLYWNIDPILRYFGASEVTLPPARDFMSVILKGTVVTHLYLGLNALLRSTNRPKKAMQATIGTVVCNCLLAPLFIFVFHWGIKGAALATVTSQLIMLCWQLKLFADTSNLIHVRRQLPHIRRKVIGKAIAIGLPQFLINLCACLVAVLMTRSLTHYGSLLEMGGDVAVGSYGISNRLVLFIVMVIIGLNQGMQPIAGYNYGAKKYDRLLETIRKALIAATVISTLGGAICVVFATPLVTLFANSSPELIEQAAHCLRVMTITFPFVGIQIICTAFFQSIDNVPKSIFLSLTRQLLFLVPLVLILPHVIANPVNGILFAMPISDVSAFMLAVILLSFQIKQFKQNIRLQD